MKSARRDSILGPGRRRLTAGMVLVVSFIAFEAIAVATVLPVVVRHLGGIRLYGWAFSAFMLAQLVGIVVAGPLVDRIGMLRPTLVAVALFSVGLAIDGAAPSMVVLVSGRVVQGAGAGVLVVALNVLVGRGYPPSLRPRAYAAMSTAWVIPGVVGPAVAGLVAEDLSWRVVFLAIIPATMAAAAIALPAIARADSAQADIARADSAQAGSDEETVAAGRPAGVGTAVALAGGTALVIEALSSRRIVLSPVLGVVGLVLVVPALRAVIPRRSGPRTTEGRQLGTMGVAALVNLAFFSAEAFLPLSLTSLHHRSVTEAGVVLTVAALTWTAGSWVQARYVSVVGPRRLCAVGLALVALGIGGVFTLDWSTTAWWVGFVAWGVAGAGMGLSYATTTLVVLSSAGAGRQGGPIAAMQVLVTLGVAFGAGVGGAALALSIALGHGRAPGLRALDAAAVVAALVGLCLTVTIPRVVPSAGARVLPESPSGRVVETAP
ncbi:MAG TPA: MFS transporter [Acidimicrobiales bacterium]|nr:MFS transporter [Acidimicrobiales bacterium]